MNERIMIDPSIRHGKPAVRGTRVPVHRIIGSLAGGATREEVTNPLVVVEEHHGAPLLNCSGLVLMRQLIERLGVARAIDAGVRVLRRCKWYRESDHILTLIYSMLSAGAGCRMSAKNTAL